MWIEKVKILLKKSSLWIIFLDNKIWKLSVEKEVKKLCKN